MKNSFRISAVTLLIILISSCKEKPAPPVITTTAVTDISYTTATSGGNATDEGGAPIISRGVCWNTSADPTIENSKTMESGGYGAFTSNLTQLTPNTLYYVRAYATNSAGTGYGNQVSFTTRQVEVPVLTTTEITAITQTTAVSGGNITDDKGGSVTARGVCWATVTNPTTANSKTTDGTGTGSFVSNLSGLQPGTIYYIRAYATNSLGTSFGNEISFTTLATVPTLTTTEVSSVTQTTVTSGGNITSDGGVTVTVRGVCWSTTQNPTTANSKTTDGSGTGLFTSSIIGLTPNTPYYLRAYATNSVGTNYGTQVSFTTLLAGQFSDIDGNVYNTVTIGTQVWMKENLKTTKYNDGTAVPLVTDNIAWSVLTTPGYCWYNNDAPTYKATYGALYNWYAVNTGKLCPTGWHAPTNAEWTILITYLGGYSIAGGKLKETGTTHWNAPNKDATNESGFTALPGGHRNGYGGAFGYVGDQGTWWSSTEGNAGRWDMYYERSDVGSDSNISLQEIHGYSVRCIKDN